MVVELVVAAVTQAVVDALKGVVPLSWPTPTVAKLLSAAAVAAGILWALGALSPVSFLTTLAMAHVLHAVLRLLGAATDFVRLNVMGVRLHNRRP